MPLLYGAVLPHPPAIIPEVGGEDGVKLYKSTITSVLHVCHKMAVVEPELLVIVSPHGVLLPDALGIRIPPQDTLIGNLKVCGGPDIETRFQIDASYAFSCVEDAQSAGLSVAGVDDPFLDFGAMVPLYYLQRSLPAMPHLISVNISLMSLQKHFDVGAFLREKFATDKRKIAAIISSDLSHCVTHDAPLPYNPEGKKFDKDIISYMKKDNPEHITLTDPFLIDEVHACGLQGIALARGMFDYTSYTYSQLSYEAPQGVGHLCADFTPKV